MKKIRALIVDDSVVIRRLVSEIFSSDPAIEDAGVAANGSIALAKIPQVNPDVITLDVDMPGMDGIQTLVEIRKSYPRLPVIMFSTLTQRAAAVTLDALAMGASDYVTKPENMKSISAGMQRVREELIPKVKALCGHPEDQLSTPFRSRKKRSSPKPSNGHPVDIVAIGVSTGGPNALADLLPAFPADFPVPIVIVQHMPPVFTKLLASRLAAKSSIEISEGVEGGKLHSGKAWIAPGDYHMAIEKGADVDRVRLNQEPQENSCRPAVDVLFRSVAEAYGPQTLAVVMTGMGQDGLRGCEDIHEGGGQVLVQDETSSVVWGMPGYVARAGLADDVLPLEGLGREIIHRVQESRSPMVAAITG